MGIPSIVISILLLILALFLIVAVLMQQGKSHNLSGTIAGGAETFFGKSKAQTMNKRLSVLTSALAIVFVVLVCILYFVQTKNESLSFDKIFGNNDEVLVEETTAHDHDHDHEETTVAGEKKETEPADTKAETKADAE